MEPLQITLDVTVNAGSKRILNRGHDGYDYTVYAAFGDGDNKNCLFVWMEYQDDQEPLFLGWYDSEGNNEAADDFDFEQSQFDWADVCTWLEKAFFETDNSGSGHLRIKKCLN